MADYRPPQRRSLTLTVGGAALDDLLEFTFDQVLVHNYSTQTVYLPDADHYVPGPAFGVFVAIPHSRRARASFKAAPVAVAVGAIVGQVAKLTFFEAVG